MTLIFERRNRMSGGSYNYACWTVENEYEGAMYDEELNLFIPDLVKVLKDLEWWQSGDIGEDDYRKSVKDFKEKWFNGKTKELAIEKIKAKAIEEIERL